MKSKRKKEQNLIAPGWTFVILGIIALSIASMFFGDFGNYAQWIMPLLGISVILSGIGFSFGIRACGQQKYGHGTWMIVFCVLTIIGCLGLFGWIMVNNYFVLTAKVR